MAVTVRDIAKKANRSNAAKAAGHCGKDYKQPQTAAQNIGYYLALDPMSKPDQRVILAVWVLLRYIDKVEPMAHYPAVYPSQIFFLKDNIGYEIVTLYDGEEHLLRLLRPEDDLKYIIIVPTITMAANLKLPKAPCIFATVDYNGRDEPDITFYSEEAIKNDI